MHCRLRVRWVGDEFMVKVKCEIFQCRARDLADVTAEEEAATNSSPRSLRLSSSAAVWRRVCLRVWHVGSRSALHQPLHWKPGEMGQRQPPLLPLSVSTAPRSYIFFSLNISPSLFYSQVAPRIKTKHLRLSTPLPAAWIWVKGARPVTDALFRLLSTSFLLV